MTEANGGAAGDVYPSHYLAHTPLSQRYMGGQSGYQQAQYYGQQQPHHQRQQKPLTTLPQYAAPLSRQSAATSHAMTVKEHNGNVRAGGSQGRKRSLSLCSMRSESSRARVTNENKGPSAKEDLQIGLKSPNLDMGRIAAGPNVVLTPLGLGNTGNGPNLNSIFRDPRIERS